MIVIEKNEGAKIPHSVEDAKLTFDDDLTINLASREQDWPVHIDVCFDQDGALVLGTAAGRAYVAEIDIPERKYVEEGEVDEEVDRVPVPLDMATVTLTLWSVE